MRVIDLFCGAGGFSEGFRQAGFDVIWGVDNWAPAVLTHQKNHPKSQTILDDVERIASLPDQEFHRIVPDSEIIIGSPPCVDFSNSNKSGKADKSRGLRLIKSFLRIVARKKYQKNSILKYWILENVGNARAHVRSTYSARDLDLKGKFVLQALFHSSHLYKAQYYSVPSKRLRFLCGEFPEPSELILSDNDLIPLKVILDALNLHRQDHRTKVIDPNYDFSMKAEDVTDHNYVQKLARFQWENARRLKQDRGYMGKMSFPEDLDKPARTIMATMSFSVRESMVFGFGKSEYRAPTIREIASLMSFPIDYRLYGNSIGIKYRLVGNAVPPKMAFAFAAAIAKKEGVTIPTKYMPKHYSKSDKDFINLNGKPFPVKKEMPKKKTAKFTYHIPSLIENTLRVELTNKHSDFKNNHFVWQAEIHKSQGVTAKWFTPDITPIWVPKEHKQEISAFIDAFSDRIPDWQTFQEYYCQTDAYRKSKKLTGPMELLKDTRSLIDSLHLNGNHQIEINSRNQKLVLPGSIAVGYYILFKILNKTRR